MKLKTINKHEFFSNHESIGGHPLGFEIVSRKIYQIPKHIWWVLLMRRDLKLIRDEFVRKTKWRSFT